MSLLSRLSANFREALAARRERWRSRDGTPIGDSPVRQFGLPARLIGWSLLGLATFFGMKYAISAIAPTASAGSVETATPLATLYLACTNPACRAASTTRQPMDFKAWPLKCDRCGQSSVQRASLCRRCNTWIQQSAAESADCWRCAELRAASQPKPPRKPSANSDDDEDGW